MSGPAPESKMNQRHNQRGERDQACRAVNQGRAEGPPGDGNGDSRDADQRGNGPKSDDSRHFRTSPAPKSGAAAPVMGAWRQE